MNRQYVKPIVGGVLLGAALFFLPGLIKLILIVAVAGFLIKMIAGARMKYAYHTQHRGGGPQGGPGGHHHHHRGHGPFGGFGAWMHPAFAEKIRNMSEEEYEQFRSKFQHKWKSRCGDWDETRTPPTQETHTPDTHTEENSPQTENKSDEQPNQ